MTGTADRTQISQHVLITQPFIADVMDLKRTTVINRPSAHYAPEPVNLHAFLLLPFPLSRLHVFLIKLRLHTVTPFSDSCDVSDSFFLNQYLLRKYRV